MNTLLYAYPGGRSHLICPQELFCVYVFVILFSFTTYGLLFYLFFFVVFDWCYLFNLRFGLNNKNKK